ncbi:HNH endonuclease signature motif containing protein [Glutamicibacter protophormiae]|uniref:HNH endonuclease signature motif containing protein n=1 Tax=Glutamicibacter protophormiae TaxID=37930 RepID=UPI00332F13A9
MDTTALAQGLTTLQHVLAQVRPAPGDALPELSGTAVRALGASLLDTLAALRETLATTTDPRLALELAATAQQLGFEATRMDLVAAERATATAAHTLAQTELDHLREHPADTTAAPVRATGRCCYRNPEELLASWTRTPYWHTHRLVLDSQDLVGRKDLTGARVPPRFEHLSALLFESGVDPSVVRQASRKLAKVEPEDRTFEGTPTAVTLKHADGRSVEEHAAVLLAQELIPFAAVKKIATLILEAINRSGPVPPAALRRGVFKLPIRSPHFREFLVRTSTAEGAWVDALIAAANKASTQAGQAARTNPASANPNATPSPGPDSGGPVAGASFFKDPTENPNQPSGQAREPQADSAAGGTSTETSGSANAADTGGAPAGAGATGAGPDGEGGWSIQDLLPEGSEQLRWDEDELFIPEATPPERALNALLEILLDASGDDPPGPTGDGDPGQGSLFDPDPENTGDDSTDIGGWPEDGDERSSGQPESSPQSEASASGSPPRVKRKRLRPVVIAHLQLADLQHLASSTAQTAHGVDLPPAALRQLLCQADLIPAVFNSDGVLLDFGRTRRFVPEVLQRAVLARDRYCLVPGCTAAVEQLEFHHTDPFALGGETKLDKIAPGCKNHHIEFDHEVVKIVWVKGLPWVLLPKDRDPAQRLRRNYSPPGVPTSIPIPDTE